MRAIFTLLFLSALVGCDQDGDRAISGNQQSAGNSERGDSGSNEVESEGVEVLVGRRASGKRLSAVGRANERERNLCLVVNAPYQSWSGEGTNVHLASYSDRFEPAGDAEVYLGKNLIGRTDEHGAFAYRQRPSGDGRGTAGNLTVRWQGKMAFVDFRSNSRTGSFEEPVIYVYTDRGYYNPGQTIHVRALAWRLRADYEPLRQQEIRLELVNEEGRVVGGGLLRTDEWGIATTEIRLPSHAREGRYKLAASHGRERAEADIQIERFLPPSISIEHDLGRYLTPRVKNLEVNLEVGYFSGGRFDAGNLDVIAKVGSDEVHRETHALKGSGPYAVDLATLLGNVHGSAQLETPVEITFEVSDDQGRRDRVRRRLRYVRNPFKAVIELDRTRYATGDTVQAMVRLVDLDNVPVREKTITLSGACLAEPIEGRTDESGVAQLSFEIPPGDSSGTLEARVLEVDGTIASSMLSVQAQLPMVSSIEKTVISERAEVPVVVRFPAKVVPEAGVVHGDVTDSSGSIVHSFTLPVVGEGAERTARGVFEAPSWGSVLLNLYCIGRLGDDDVGLLTDGQSLVVHPGRELEIIFDGVPNQAAPGKSFSAKVRVIRRDGKALDTMLGVSVVDSAVLSLLDPLERSPIDRFYNPERRVLASTGSQTLTWPVVSRNWGASRQDIGWPPHFGFHSGLTEGRLGKAVFSGCGGGARSASGGYDEEDEAVAASPADAAAGVPARAGGADGPGEPGGGSPRIVLRTNFSETSLWRPRLPAPGGHGTFDVELPDSITRHRVTVVATDQEGGIGIGTREVDVNQTLHVRAVVPASMSEGDQIEIPVVVRNLSDEGDEVRVTLDSDELQVSSPNQKTLTVGPGATETAWFMVAGRVPGKASYEATAVGTAIIDIERRDFFIRPRGIPGIESFRGTTKSGEPFSASFRITSDDRYSIVRIGITLPTTIPALQGLMYLEAEDRPGLDPSASRALANAAVFRYLRDRDLLDTERREELQSRLGEAATVLLMSQNSDGGWGWFWDRQSHPFMSAYALRTLIELQALDFPVPSSALASAGAYLISALGDDGLYDMSAIAAWEGESDDIRLAGTADVFATLSMLPGSARPDGFRAGVRPLAERFRDYLDSISPSPLTLAHAVLGLHRIGGAVGLEGLDPELREAARRLARIRRDVHWEPGWFQAYGGTIEATAVALQVLQELDPEGYEAAQADAVQFLLSTRRSWGAWHNARSTAFAIRALMQLSPEAEERGGELIVRLDDEEVRRIEVDPADPYGSALAIRELELENVGRGHHEVVVSYDGSLPAQASIAVERWEGMLNNPPLSWVREDLRLSIVRESPGDLEVGEIGELSLTLNSTGAVGPIVVEQAIPPTVVVERSSLQDDVDSRVLTRFELDDTSMRLSFEAGGQRRVVFRAYALTPGRLVISPASATAVLRPSVRAYSASSALIVQD